MYDSLLDDTIKVFYSELFSFTNTPCLAEVVIEKS